MAATLSQQLRQARQNENSEEITRIKKEMGILTRNMTTNTIMNKKGKILRVTQSYTVAEIDKAVDTIENEIYV